MAKHYGYFNYWYEPANPKEVRGGIKAQSKRGAFTSKWWGKRWIETLESFNIGARLARGRTYARKGQVTSLEISKGKVIARVQGTSANPYRISIEFKTFTAKDWQQIIEKLAEQPLFSAQLLGNEMPEEIETVFNQMHLPLFPEKHRDLTTECSCPDWSNPCKHIAAVLYLMAEAFDRDAFLIFTLRGMPRDEFLKALQAIGANKKPEAAEFTSEPEPLPVDPNDFWGDEVRDLSGFAAPLPVKLHAALPKRLGSLSFWRSEKGFINQLEILYANTLLQANQIFEKIC
jgi:uncharacterized Zn finger protein